MDDEERKNILENNEKIKDKKVIEFEFEIFAKKFIDS